MSAQLARLSNAINPDHAAESAGAAVLDAGEGIFEHGTVRRRDGEPARTLEKEVRCGLAAKILLRADLFLAYGWASQRSVPAIRDQVAAALAAARHTGWQRLLDEQRTYLDEFWERADVELEGDAELQQAVRFAL